LHTPFTPPHEPRRKPTLRHGESAQFWAYAIRPYGGAIFQIQMRESLRHRQFCNVLLAELRCADGGRKKVQSANFLPPKMRCINAKKSIRKGVRNFIGEN